jgi:hypothetical protein
MKMKEEINPFHQLILLNIRIGGTFQNEYEKYKLQI